MPYSIQLVSFNTATFGLSKSSTAWGFPTDAPFHTMIMSYWMCGPTDIHDAYSGIGPVFDAVSFFEFKPGPGVIAFMNGHFGATVTFYNGSFAQPPAGVRAHFLLSVDTHAQVVQLYINDQGVPVTGGTWIGTPPFDFAFTGAASIWQWNVESPLVSPPALADAWISNTPSFVDLSVTANRRRFINADLSPVDLGDTGTNPFGYQPAMYMSVRPGGVPSDLFLNRGIDGGLWNAGWTPTFQAPGVCTLPEPPPPRLAMDNVICTTAAPLSQNLISLSSSDDRGHSYGSPVSQSMGEAGEYRTSLQWNRLGMARDRVFKLEWSVAAPTALQGCWIDVTPASS